MMTLVRRAVSRRLTSARPVEASGRRRRVAESVANDLVRDILQANGYTVLGVK